MTVNRYYPLSVHFRQRFGRRVQKISLDAGSTCPNRDGALSTRGCAFCNERGSGTDQARLGKSLTGQYLEGREKYRRRMPKALFMAYVQSFSNTYGPADRLRSMISEVACLPDMAGLAIGTRPDCLDEEKLDILRAVPLEEIWLDIGLQSARDATLQRINRGHDAACFAVWARRSAAKGLKICAHVITGLPGESLEHFEATMAFVSALPVAGVKIHNLYVCHGSSLAEEWRRGTLRLLSREDSIVWAVRGLELLRPDIVVHRMNGDPDGDELVAPDWAGDKRGFLEDIRRRLEALDTWQGKALGYPLDARFNLPPGQEGHASGRPAKR